jgi:hypothetical protein
MTRCELAKQAGPICGKCGRWPSRLPLIDHCSQAEYEQNGHYLETETAEQVAARLGCEIEEEDICGLCGQPDADKMAKWTGGAIYWPGERKPDTEMVHSNCEQEECARAHGELSHAQRDRVIDDAAKYGMNPVPKKFRY